MVKSINPGVAIAVFLNVILLLGIPFFGEGEASRLAPIILLALAMPWILYFVVGHLVSSLRKDLIRQREKDEPSDFV